MIGTNPLSTVAELLVFAGLLLYAGCIAVGVFRVSRQYSRAMRGSAGLRFQAAFAAAGRCRWALIPAAVGLALLALARFA